MPLMKGLASEHPRCDSLQRIFLVVYFAIWALDSFILHYSTIFAGGIHVFIRFFMGLFLLVVGIYFVLNAHNVVFVNKAAKPQLITTGVYARVRHPMYLGTLLFCLGFFFITVSLFAFLVWIIFFVFYDKMVSYEEESLIQIIGHDYIRYQKQVSRWVPSHKKGHSTCNQSN